MEETPGVLICGGLVAENLLRSQRRGLERGVKSASEGTSRLCACAIYASRPQAREDERARGREKHAA